MLSNGLGQPVGNQQKRQSPKSETVLLVQSDHTLLVSLQQLLENDGYTTLVADSGDAALSACELHEGTIDVLITDMRVGSPNGFELAIAVGAAYDSIAVVFTDAPPSLHTFECDLCRIAAAHFLPKPFHYSQLRSTLLQLRSRTEQTLEWLYHSYPSVQASQLVAAVHSEKLHPVTVQLEAVERDEALLVRGIVRHRKRTLGQCFIELLIERSGKWRELRVSDLEDVIQPTTRLIVQLSARSEFDYERYYRRERRKQERQNRSAFGLLLLAALHGHPGLLSHASSAENMTPAASDSKSNEIIPLVELEKRAIISALDLTHGDKVLAAAGLGIGKTTLYQKLKEYGIR